MKTINKHNNNQNLDMVVKITVSVNFSVFQPLLPFFFSKEK